LNTVSGPSSPITVSGFVTVTGNYVTQYQVTFAQTGLDLTATGRVITVNGSAKVFGDLSYALWVDNGSSIPYSYNSTVLSSSPGEKFVLTGVGGPSSPLTVTGPVTVTGNYKTQYKVTFGQSGVGADFTGTVVTVDSINYNLTSLSVQFWWDQASNHSFAFASPLTVNSSMQYTWSSTSGLSSLQSGILTVNASGSVTGNYMIQNSVTFSQTGASSDFTGTVVIIDGNSYNISALSATFYWPIGTTHNFTFQSPLVVTLNGKQYVWTSTTGLSSAQSGSINITTFGSIVGHYKTQYYVTLATNPSGLNNPSGSGWYDDGTYASITSDQYVPGGSRWRFAGWTTTDMSEITNSSSPSTTVLVDMAKTVTANYVHQYYVTFTQTGLTSDASGTIVTVNGTTVTYAGLSYGIWIDAGSTTSYSYGATVTSSMSGKQFSLTGITGPSSPITVNADTNVTGNYKVQYYLSVSSPYGTAGGQGWYDNGTTAYATLDISSVDHGNGTRHVFTSWGSDASGTNYAQSNPLTMSGPKTAVTNWKTQYSVTFAQSGLDPSSSGTVVTVNGTPVTYGQLPYPVWADSGDSITFSYNNVSSSTTGKTFVLIGVTGLPSPITVASPMTATGNYKTQYQVTFNQTGVGSDFSGAIVRIDGTDYNYGALPSSFWWDNGSSHTFSFYSPLVVNISKQYNWASTSGLSTLQSDTLLISGSGSVTGNYTVENKVQITFSQTGVNTDFTGTVVTIDGVNYTVTGLPLPFWWDTNSIHTFAYQSPLIVTPSAQKYVWTSTSGLSTLQGDTITATTSGNITGNYKTQYYLILTTVPSGVNSPSGAGWYDANTNATISTTAFVDIVPGCSRYRFNGWTTTNMTEIADPTRSPTTVLMDEAKTVTANYVAQYVVVFKQVGGGSDFTGTVVAIDTINYNVTALPATFYWDNGTTHSFDFKSPLIVTPNAKSYVWTSTSGLSTQQSDFVVVVSCGNITGNYETQYYLTVATSPPGIATIPGEGWYNDSASVTLTAPLVSNYSFAYWLVNGVSQGASVNPITLTMNAAKNATAQYTPITPYTLIIITTPGGTTNPSPGTYTYSSGTTVLVTAIPDSGYVLDHWELYSNNVSSILNPIPVTMNMNHTLKAIFSLAPPPPTVTISPPDSTITLGKSVFFTSSVSGGTAPYSYQWYLNGAPVSGATAVSWTFFPTSTGMNFVYLKVTDANNNTAYSNNAKVTVFTAPVGGYSVSLAKHATLIQMASYTALIGLFAAAIIVVKRKRK
ncbi:MAG: hypothetical protein ABSB28_08760, partial [Candidatus Bathyarchaeia archaeon]